jgi:hypothetical protein
MSMIDFKRFSPQELFVGAFAAAGTIRFLGWKLGLAVMAGSAVLWVLGGTYKKAIRRFGVPALIGAFAYFTGHWSPIATGLGVAVLHLGDGFPDRRATTKDEGSWLGRMVEKYVDDRDYIGGPATKLLIALIFQVPLLIY